MLLGAGVFSQGSSGKNHTQGSKNASDVPSEEFLLLDYQKEKSLVITLPSRSVTVKIADNVQSLGVDALSAKFLGSGEVLFIDNSLALKKIGAEGTVELLPPGSANAPLFISGDQQHVAYLKPRNFYGEALVPLSNGIAVMNLASGKEQILLEIPDVTVHLYGWAGSDSLAIEVPYWSPETFELSDRMLIGLLHIGARESYNARVAPPDIFTSLPAIASGSSYPRTSFDQKYITYESDHGVIVASLRNPTYYLASDVHDPRWADTGLTVVRGFKRIKATEDMLSLKNSPSVSGKLPLPDTKVSNYSGFANSTFTDESFSTASTLFYRPVAASIPVSAYYDLNRANGAWRDWHGHTGSSFSYGHTYDNHNGTDYDGNIGDSVYAAQTGKVIERSISCVNTFDSGIITYGTFVRLDHGRLSDGNSYQTLYGHLKCDAVSVVSNQYVGVSQLLAQMGNTGYSTGPHMHFDVFKNGARIDPYDLRIVSDSPSTGDTSQYEGFLDEVNCDRISGWARNKTQPNTPVDVNIYDGNNLVARVTANGCRADLENAGIGCRAFSLPTPASLKDGRRHQIWAKIAGPEHNLSNSPKIIANGSSEDYRPNNHPPLHPNGTLVKVANDPSVWLLQNGQKRAIMSGDVLNNLYANGGFDYEDVITVSSDELALYPHGEDITDTLPSNGRSRPDGRLIRNPNGGEISIVTNNGQRRPFNNGYLELGYVYCKAEDVADYSSYPEGPIAGAMPLVTSGLSLSPSGSYKVGDTISANFTITNVGPDGITFNKLLVGGRINGGTADFTTAQYITLNPGQAYNYSGTLQLSRAGNYNFFVAYQDTAGFWTITVPAKPGAKTSESINVAALTPDFAISATLSARTITRGEIATYTVTAQSLNSFNGSVSLSVLNLPGNQVLAGTGFNPQQVTPPSNGSINSTLSIVTDGATPTGNFTITVRGVSGSLVREVPINLTVNAAPTPTPTPTPTPQSQWASLGGWIDKPAVASNLDGRLTVFVIGSDNALYHRNQVSTNSGSWTNWSSLGGWIDRLAVASNADGRLLAFARGADGALWYRSQATPGSAAWTPWSSLGGWIDRLAVASNADGRLEVFARSGDGALWRRAQAAPNAQSWSNWSSLGGWIDTPRVGRNADGRLEVFVIGGDNALYHKSQVVANSADWTAWSSLGGWLDDLAVTSNADGRLVVFARGSGEALWYRTQGAPNSGAWDAWSSLGGVINYLAAGKNADGRVEVFVRGRDQALWRRSQSSAGSAGWGAWSSLGGAIDDPVLSMNPDGRLEVFVRWSDRALWHKWQSAPGTW